MFDLGHCIYYDITDEQSLESLDLKIQILIILNMDMNHVIMNLNTIQI